MTEFLKKDPKVDLRLKYKRVLETSLIISLVIMIGVFYSFKKFDIAIELPESPDIKIEIMEIPPTQQIQRPPHWLPIGRHHIKLVDDLTQLRVGAERHQRVHGMAGNDPRHSPTGRIADRACRSFVIGRCIE